MPTNVPFRAQKQLAWISTAVCAVSFGLGTTACGSGTGEGALGGSGGSVGAAGGTKGGAFGGASGDKGGSSAGGQSGSGGQLASGGTDTGGTRPSGGNLGAGGVSGNSGGNATGGNTGGRASGGAPASGGKTSSSQGGAAGGGGTLSMGGAVSMGGTLSTGGMGTATGKLIRNDTFWKDTSGNFIYSQGGGVLQVGDTFYWYGVKYNGAVTYAANPTSKNGDTSFAGVTIYSSKDLANWKLENTVKFSNAGGWFGRLGVVYNANTKKYDMVAQGAGGLFFAKSDTPTGNFVFDNVQITLPDIVNGNTGDQTLFQDDDGKAYLICSNVEGRSNLYVVPLRESDFLAIGTPTRIFRGAGREGNALFKYNGHYYFCSSDLHGWNSSHTYCIAATNILGPYGTEFVMTNTDADFSHVTQTGFFVTVKGTKGSFVIFAGDRWSDFAGNGIGYNQWMPLSFDGTNPVFHSLSEWNIDAQAGTWSVGAKNNWALNPSFEADRVSTAAPAGWTATNSSNVSGGHTGRWSWQLANSASLDQQVTNLPNGTYTLSAWVKGSGASGAKLYAKGFGGSEASASVANANGSWTNITLPGIAVSNGKCQIGVSTTAGSLSVDDFALVMD